MGSSTYALDDTKVLYLEGPFGFTFEVSIGFPPTTDHTNSGVPVLFVLDAPTTFPIAVTAARTQALIGLAPNMVVVGISTPREEGVVAHSAKRLKYLTPGAPELDDQTEPIIRGLIAPTMQENGWSIQECFGGASEFLSFIDDVVFPRINDLLKFDLIEKSIYGHSASGAFVMDAILNNPRIFSSHMLSSFGTQWWRDFDQRLEDRISSIETEESTTPLKVFHAAGGQELDDPLIRNGFGTPILQRLEQRNIRGLELVTRVFPGENHASVIPAAISSGIRTQFGINRTFAEGIADSKYSDSRSRPDSPDS